jgi:suppressor of ftsI
MRARAIVFVAVILTLGVGAALLIAGRDDDKEGGSTDGAATTPAVSTVSVEQPAPFQPGMPFTEPPVVYSKNGMLRATLVAQNGTVPVSGVAVAGTQTYAVEGAGERGFLGPTLHVKPGERVELTLDNRITVPDGAQAANCADHGGAGHAPQADSGDPQRTNLHFHGLHVTPRERSPYGDTVLVGLPHGRSRFSFAIPDDHDKGTFWYHAHLHGCTDDQVFRGLAGLLLIGDSRRDLPERFWDIETRSLALKDVQVVQAGGRGEWEIDPKHAWFNPTHRTVNGLVNPTMSIRPGETQMWRLANVSAGVWYQVALVDESNDDAREQFTVVAQDGNALLRPERATTLLIPPGARFDVLVRGPDSGPRVLKTLPFDQGFRVLPEDKLATVAVEGSTARPIAPPARLTPPTQRFPRKRGPTRRFVFDIDLRDTELHISDTSVQFTINNNEFDPTSPDATPTLGTTERWILYNKSAEWHPFHIHQDDFRVITTSAGGQPQLSGDHDIVALPPGTPVKPSRTEIEIPFTDYPGRFVFHCHILDHEDAGMMSLVELRRPQDAG